MRELESGTRLLWNLGMRLCSRALVRTSCKSKAWYRKGEGLIQKGSSEMSNPFHAGGTALVSQTIPFAERGRVWSTATIELSPGQKLAMTNEIHSLYKLHLLSWSSNYVTTCLADVSILSNGTVWYMRQRWSVTRPFLSAKVWLVRLAYLLNPTAMLNWQTIWVLYDLHSGQLPHSNPQESPSTNELHSNNFCCLHHKHDGKSSFKCGHQEGKHWRPDKIHHTTIMSTLHYLTITWQFAALQ